MDLNKALNNYQNPELENYLQVKEIFKTKGFKISNAFELSKRFDKDNNPLFYYFDFIFNRSKSFLRIGLNSIPIFLDDTLEFTGYPSKFSFEISPSKFNLGTNPGVRSVMGISEQRILSKEISSQAKPGDTHFVLKLKKEGTIRDLYESVIDSNELSTYLQPDVFLSNPFFEANKDIIKTIIDSREPILHDFQLDNLLYLKILYYDGLNKKLKEYSLVRTKKDRELFLKSLRNDAIKRGKKLERVYLYTQNLLKKDLPLNQLIDFTYFRFI